MWQEKKMLSLYQENIFLGTENISVSEPDVSSTNLSLCNLTSTEENSTGSVCYV